MNKFNLGDVVYTITVNGRDVVVRKGEITKMMFRGPIKDVIYCVDKVEHHEKNVFSDKQDLVEFLRYTADVIADEEG